MPTLKVLLTGATGFIGGSVLSELLSSTDPRIKGLEITAIARGHDQVDILARAGMKAMLFNGLDDTRQLREIAPQYDIVLHCATGLHTASAEALILGLGDSMEKTGRQTYHIHTTGTSNLAYSILSSPNHTMQDLSDTDMIYEEEVRRNAENLYDQRTTDLVVIATADKTGVKAFLMMPPTVYGKGLGCFKTQSIQVPFAIRRTIDAGHPEYIGDGSGTVGYVHICDLADLYLLLLCRILDGAEIPCGRTGYYFSNTGAFTWKYLNEKIGNIGVRLGVLKSGTPTSITLDDAVNKWDTFREGKRLLIETNFAARSKTTPKNAYMLGWQPKKSAKDWDDEIETTWKAVLAEKQDSSRH
ncbi:hypothetical protein BDV06DRAFT_216216 [Aspergillus oleicola]